jgi:negative regulator of flagellin synthesis FlgM
LANSGRSAVADSVAAVLEAANLADRRRSTMQIFGPAQVHGPQTIQAPHSLQKTAGAPQSPASAGISDELQLSDTAQAASQLNDIPAIRQDRVDAIRAQIAQGTYETPEKLSAALDNLLDEIG